MSMPFLQRNPPLRFALTACAFTAAVFTAFQAVTLLASVVPLLRTEPGPLARRLIKTSKVKVKPLPKGVKRIYIEKEGGLKRIVEDDGSGVDGTDYRIEVLTNVGCDEGHLAEGEMAHAPLVFLHGGMGSARCYDRWMEYFSSERKRHVFSISLRGHGNSTRPSNFTRLTKASFAEDLDTALAAIHELLVSNTQSISQTRPVLIAHSAGGGIAQYYLTIVASASYTPQALVLVAPFPPFGGYPVYSNWNSFDPWFALRFIWDGCDPMSPLSTPELVKRAFFADSKALTRSVISGNALEDSVEEFFEQMNPEENGAWPASMMFRFADPAKVKSSVNGKVHLITASHDRLMSQDIMQRVQEAYGNVDRKGIGMDVVQGSGHHIMFDDQWKEALKFLESILEVWGV